VCIFNCAFRDIYLPVTAPARFFALSPPMRAKLAQQETFMKEGERKRGREKNQKNPFSSHLIDVFAFADISWIHAREHFFSCRL
jgi:hypothetical protein